MTLARRGEGSILPTLNHPHIIRTFGSEGWGTSHVEIVLNLMDGNLASLAEGMARPRRVLAKHVLCQMLQALDYLSVRGYVHRDVKPDNIFFVLAPGYGGRDKDRGGDDWDSDWDRGTGASPFPFHFRLGDFGLCEHESRIDAGTVRGTTAFMAPELFPRRPRGKC
ncbi:hypothetical protein MYCTH_2121454 [Thermothelomyces thermophilus ATCC 42464]|uniref:non-specific serine/threonine protein kinase n=1 Tax=Thermothelomyces thermophilus (strain ATCC 42464 / BCRC 31852 / DSM 1799) TaxID=573729 RepID=G2QPY9_THET4|nr:uncharacterized protein MYCTH_2121454 [Thermothelomyces thermophilus ATCC 42464]AEO61652.1 hypothetical protein MYCTH_2121454 [Thermothelomyces thermophilus ATCC 42464]